MAKTLKHKLKNPGIERDRKGLQVPRYFACPIGLVDAQQSCRHQNALKKCPCAARPNLESGTSLYAADALQSPQLRQLEIFVGAIGIRLTWGHLHVWGPPDPSHPYQET